MFGWPSRPTKVECRSTIAEADGANRRRIFEIGKYQVEVPDDPEADVTYHVPHYRHGQSEPRTAFPNMEVEDGVLRIPIEDMVAAVLSRVSPVEAAQALWQNDEVKAAFMDALVTRYNERGIDDGDRRKFLAGVKEAVHSKALDTFTYAAQKLEYDFGRKWFFYHEINRVNEALHQAGYVDRDGNAIRLQHEDHDPVFKISGDNWNEAREHFRQEALKLFAMPKEEREEIVTADEVPF